MFLSPVKSFNNKFLSPVKSFNNNVFVTCQNTKRCLDTLEASLLAAVLQPDQLDYHRTMQLCHWGYEAHARYTQYSQHIIIRNVYYKSWGFTFPFPHLGQIKIFHQTLHHLSANGFLIQIFLFIFVPHLLQVKCKFCDI